MTIFVSAGHTGENVMLAPPAVQVRILEPRVACTLPIAGITMIPTPPLPSAFDSSIATSREPSTRIPSDPLAFDTELLRLTSAELLTSMPHWRLLGDTPLFREITFERRTRRELNMSKPSPLFAFRPAPGE